MAERTPDDRPDDDPAHLGDAHPGDAHLGEAELGDAHLGDAELGDAVEDALSPELRRRRARFVQAIMGVDRAEGVGRGEKHWNESLYRDVGGPPPESGD